MKIHALDIPFKFYNVEGAMAGAKPDRFDASKNMSSFWANFARNGRPSAKGQPDWSALDLQNQPLMRIDTECLVINNRNKLIREMWKRVL